MPRTPALIQFWIYVVLAAVLAAVVLCGCNGIDIGANAKVRPHWPTDDVCPVPDKGPNVFIDYFYAPSCGPCKAASATTASLERQGYIILYRNTDTAGGRIAARTFEVNAIPTWLVTVDGRRTLRTSDARELTQHLHTVK